MNRRKWKEIALYFAAAIAARAEFAGCYPLIPGVFAAVCMEEVNKTLLLIFSIFGMALFTSVQAMAKYTMVLLITGVVVKLAEWAYKSCRIYVGAGAAAVSVLLLTMAGELLLIRNRAAIWMGVLEAVLVYTLVLVLSPVVHIFLEERLLYVFGKKDTGQTAPEHGEKLQTYAQSFSGLSQIFSRMESTGRMPCFLRSSTACLVSR